MFDAYQMAALTAEKRAEMDLEVFAPYEAKIYQEAVKGNDTAKLFVGEVMDDEEFYQRLRVHFQRRGFKVSREDADDTLVTVSWGDVKPVEVTDEELSQLRRRFDN